MVHIRSFDTPEEMQEYLRAAESKAHEGLHLAQRDISYGDYWVRFVDLDNRVIEFGRVHTLEEIASNLMGTDDVTHEDAELHLATIETNLERGYMFGEAHSPLGSETGLTHKAHVWPIEERLFNMAAEADWHIDRLPDSGRILLTEAFEAMRGHVIGSS